MISLPLCYRLDRILCRSSRTTSTASIPVAKIMGLGSGTGVGAARLDHEQRPAATPIDVGGIVERIGWFSLSCKPIAPRDTKLSHSTNNLTSRSSDVIG